MAAPICRDRCWGKGADQRARRSAWAAGGLPVENETGACQESVAAERCVSPLTAATAIRSLATSSSGSIAWTPSRTSVSDRASQLASTGLQPRLPQQVRQSRPQGRRLALHQRQPASAKHSGTARISAIRCDQRQARRGKHLHMRVGGRDQRRSPALFRQRVVQRHTAVALLGGVARQQHAPACRRRGASTALSRTWRISP